MSDVRRKFSVAASNPNVVAAASSLLPRGNAIDALAAGVLAACADSRAVLLGPLQILVARRVAHDPRENPGVCRSHTI